MIIDKRAISFFAALVGLVSVAPETARAQWALLSEEDELRGKAIADVGELITKSRITSGAYKTDPISGERRYIPGETLEWLEFRGEKTICFDEDYLNFSGSRTAALLLVDENARAYVAIIESSIGSIEVEVRAAIPTRCPII